MTKDQQKSPGIGIRSLTTAFQAYLAIEQGQRDEQQDSADFFERDGRCLAMVCDGAGGHRGGHKASLTAVETARIAFENANGIFDDPRAMLEEICREADQKIRQLGESPKLSPKSTIAMVYIAGKTAHWVHVGDTRIYRLRAGRIEERTRDHSVVQILFEQGEVAEDDMGTHPDQGRLLRALGSGEDLKVTHGSADVVGGDGFLICSDGFWERTKAAEIEGFFKAKASEATLQAIVLEAVRRNGPKGDNTTALAIIARSAPKPNSLLRILLALFGFLTGAIAGTAAFLWLQDSTDFLKFLSRLLAKINI
jgi:serine/threonine protein phosphatase PrpC